MNIQIFGRSKCFDTKKAQRWFKERRVKFQFIDLDRYGMSKGELQSVVNALGLSAVMEEKAPGAEILRYLAADSARFEKLLENPDFIKSPLVRNGRQATVGYCPEIWSKWE